MKSSFFIPFLKRFSAPLLLLAVSALAYGWQVHQLGFFWDDWVFVYRYRALGLANTVLYGNIRQLGFIALLPGFLFSGDSPLLWHLYSLLLRWLVAVLAWWVLRLLWPGQKTSVTLMAAIFAVHPAFSQQSIAVVYSLQIFNYGLLLASLGLMLLAEQSPRRGWLWRILALLTQALHLFIVEYFVGLDLIRPLLLFFTLQTGSTWNRIKTTLWRWLPYLGVFAVYALWRSGLFTGGFVDYEYKTITALFQTDPRLAVLETIEYGLKDMLVLLVKTWAETLAPSIIDLAQPYNLFSLLVAGFSALGLYVGLLRYIPADEEETDARPFLTQASLLGLFAALVGFIPAWFVRRHIVEPGNFGDRLALASLFGASILLVAVLRFFSGSRHRNLLLASIFIGLAIGAQMRYSNSYRRDWERQLRTYWQVYWRAPALADGTALVGYNAISTTTVNYVGAFAFNHLYGIAPGQPRVWYVNYPKTKIPSKLEAFLAGEWVYVDELGRVSASVRRDNSLGLDYDTPGRCVRILVPGDPSLDDLPADFQPVLGFSDPHLILAESAALPPRHIFGPPPAPDWCTYFQKASLARQLGDWPGVLALKQQADQAGLGPLHPDELMPFIEAYARSGDLPAAQALTLQSYEMAHRTRFSLCKLWAQLGQPAPAELTCP